MDDSERRKAIELLKEMRTDKAEDGKPENQESRLNWMYKGPSEMIDREEYLLGKAIDRTFEALNSGGNSEVLGRTQEQSNVPKRVLEKTDNMEQVDIAKKILEDPLYAIKQKELEARKKLLNNPVKLKQLKQMLLERSKNNSSHKKQKKKNSKKDKSSTQELDLLILKVLRKFTDKEKRKALSSVMNPDSDYNSSDSDSSEERPKKVKKKKTKQSKSKRKRSPSSSDDDSDSSSDPSGSSDENKSTHKYKKRKKNNEIKKKRKHKNKKESSSDSNNSDSDRNKKSVKKESHKKKSKKSSSSSSSRSSSSTTTTTSSSETDSSNDNEKSKKSKTNSAKSQHDHRDKRKNSERDGRDRSRKTSEKGNRRGNSEERKSVKNYGLMMPDGSMPENKRRLSPVQKYEKKVETKGKYIPPPKAKPLSEKEKEQKLKEMMEDAKLRKADREKSLASHRKKEAQEEESKTYDDDFMRRQMSHLTSQGTMADRIKSNINNIQRSKSSMDSNFMRK